MLHYFENHAFECRNALVLLDVDGTIMPDGASTSSGAVVDKVRELEARGNEVYLCSNSRRANYEARLAAIASQLGVKVCPGRVRKPLPLVLSGLDRNGRALVVIGDKDLTDGLLARCTRAQFIKVRRKVDAADRPVAWLTSLFDDVFGPIALFLWDLLSGRRAR